MQKYGEIIRSIRKSKGMTLSDTSKGIISMPFLSKFERGESDISSVSLFKILDRLNIDIKEFDLLVNGFLENEQQQFLKKLRIALIEDDLNYLKISYNEQFHKYETDKNVRYQHNMLIIHFYICNIEKKSPKKMYIDKIKEYLLNIDDWGYYELTLYGNVLLALPTNLVVVLTKTACAKGAIYLNLSPVHNQLALILLNTITTLIDSNEFSQINYFISKTESVLNHTEWLYEKNKLNFLKGIVLIHTNNYKKGKEMCNKSIQTFYDFNLNEVGKTHQEYLQKVLDYSI